MGLLTLLGMRRMLMPLVIFGAPEVLEVTTGGTHPVGTSEVLARVGIANDKKQTEAVGCGVGLQRRRKAPAETAKAEDQRQ